MMKSTLASSVLAFSFIVCCLRLGLFVDWYHVDIDNVATSVFTFFYFKDTFQIFEDLVFKI